MLTALKHLFDAINHHKEVSGLSVENKRAIDCHLDAARDQIEKLDDSARGPAESSVSEAEVKAP